jgi:hypothetical protein
MPTSPPTSVSFKLFYFRQALAEKQADLCFPPDCLAEFSQFNNISAVSLGGKCPAETKFRGTAIEPVGKVVFLSRPVAPHECRGYNRSR